MHLFIYVNILLFHWVFFTYFVDHYVEQNMFYSFRSSHWEIFYKITVLNQGYSKPIKICPVRTKVAGYRSAKSNFSTGIFQKLWSYNFWYYLKNIDFLQNTFLNGYIEFQWLILLFSLIAIWMQLLNLVK